MSSGNSGVFAPTHSPISSPSPIPQAGSAPRAPAGNAVPTPLRTDGIAPPVARALQAPPPSHGAPDPVGSLPVVVAAGLVAGGAVVALPALEVAGGMVAAGVRTVGASLAKSGPYATTALRDFATKYREGAAEVRGLKLGDPHVLGETLGAQAWMSTEEIARSTVVGAGLGGGAWAAQKLCSAVADAITRRPDHAAQR